MHILNLNHYNIRTHELEKTRQFYEEVAGLRVGDRPPFDFPGYWLYGGDDTPILHLVGVDQPTGRHEGAMDHIAFQCVDLDGMKRKLDKLGVEYQQRTVAMGQVTQLFLTDPHGIRLELNFPV